jgi:hypothetical protein
LKASPIPNAFHSKNVWARSCFPDGCSHGGSRRHSHSAPPQDPVREHRALQPLPALPDVVSCTLESQLLSQPQQPVRRVTPRPRRICFMVSEVFHHLALPRRHSVHSFPPTGTIVKILLGESSTRLFHFAQAFGQNCSSADLHTGALHRRCDRNGGCSDNVREATWNRLTKWTGPSALHCVIDCAPGALPQAGMDRASGPLEIVRIVDSHYEAGPQAPKARHIRI